MGESTNWRCEKFIRCVCGEPVFVSTEVTQDSYQIIFYAGDKITLVCPICGNHLRSLLPVVEVPA